jgi:hypothetical protein
MEIYKSCALQEWKEKCKTFIFFFFATFLYWIVLYIVIPMSVNFALSQWSSPQSVYIRLSYWVGKTSVLASGVELPIIIYFLTKLGLVTPAFKNLSQIRYCTCSCRGCHNATGCCKSNYRCNTNVINLWSIFISVLVTKNKIIIMSAIIEEFNDYRSKMNEKLLTTK